MVATRTKLVQDRVYKELRVRVDQVKPGFGTSNTGNVARKCFENAETFARCLDLDVQFVKDISLIITLFRCKKMLNLDELEVLCKKTYWKHKELFPWATMSPTVHKVLWHGCEIARLFQSLGIPLSYTAEDAGETMHTFWKKVFARKARQISRKMRISDTHRRGMIFTDPALSLVYIKDRVKKQGKHKPLPAAALKYILPEKAVEAENYDEDEDLLAETNVEDTDDEEDVENEQEGVNDLY